MNHFDVQRVESLMRYAEFLKEMECYEYAKDVINLLHSEIVGIDRFKEFDSVSEFVADDSIVHQEYSIHPEIKKYVQEQIKQLTPEVYHEEMHAVYGEDMLYEVTRTEDIHPRLKHYIKQLIKETVKVDSD